MSYFPDNMTRIRDTPITYLLGPAELNNDASNYWIFSDSSFRRLAERAGFSIVSSTFENSHDCTACDPELGRETAGRREPGAGTKASVRHGLPQCGGELSVDRDLRRTVELRLPQRRSRRRRMPAVWRSRVSSCHSHSLRARALLDHGAPHTRTGAAHLTKVALGNINTRLAHCRWMPPLGRESPARDRAKRLICTTSNGSFDPRRSSGNTCVA